MSSQTPTTHLASEDVVLSSPMSLTGGTKRVFRWLNLQFPAITNHTLRVAVITAWWLLVGVWILGLAISLLLVWNILAWTIFLIPMLIIRGFGRSKRRNKADALRHREMLDAANKQR